MEAKRHPLAQVEDLEELRERYRIYDSHVLARWMEAITGPHRQAIQEVLQERELPPE